MFYLYMYKTQYIFDVIRWCSCCKVGVSIFVECHFVGLYRLDFHFVGILHWGLGTWLCSSCLHAPATKNPCLKSGWWWVCGRASRIPKSWPQIAMSTVAWPSGLSPFKWRTRTGCLLACWKRHGKAFSPNNTKFWIFEMKISMDIDIVEICFGFRLVYTCVAKLSHHTQRISKDIKGYKRT